MTNLEKLLEEIHNSNVEVKTLQLPQNISGLYYDDYIDKPIIMLNKNLETESEQICVLAEEMGHHYTSHGDILTDSEVDNVIVQQQEIRAKRWATKKLVSIKKIIKAYEAGCQSIYDMAEYLGITEDFLKKSLKTYAEIFGSYKRRGNYIIYFDPPAVLKLFE